MPPDLNLISDLLAQCLAASAAQHDHLCPRQVLGARFGLAGAARLGLALPRADKRLLVIVETDGCFVDGVSAATGCTVGHRTLRVEDYGKVAATFVDVQCGRALRLAPRPGARERAWEYAPGEDRHYYAMLNAYRVMPEAELLQVEEVRLATPVEALISRPGVRACCAACGEEIINEREIVVDGRPLCRACAGSAYYVRQDSPARQPGEDGREQGLP